MKRDGRAVSLDKCFRATVRMYVLSADYRGPPGVPRPRQGAHGARRRNFSIRFPSGALINCGQLLKRRNEGTAPRCTRIALS